MDFYGFLDEPESEEEEIKVKNKVVKSLFNKIL